MSGSPVPLTIACLGRAEHLRDFGTNCHARRVALMIEQLGLELGVAAERCKEMANAALLHDIGKMAVPLDLLNKPAGLSVEEFAVVKMHCRRGHAILKSYDDKVIMLASEIALRHHERYDGSGYPDGLAGKAIAYPARITAVCDTYDALRQDRPYRRGMTHAQAMSKIVDGDGRTLPDHFDPDILKAFKELSSKIKTLFEKYNPIDDEAELMA